MAELSRLSWKWREWSAVKLAAAVLSSSETIFRISDCCCGESLASFSALNGTLGDPGAGPSEGALRWSAIQSRCSVLSRRPSQPDPPAGFRD